MDIYSDGQFFDGANSAKWLMNDSFMRTSRGFDSICEGRVLRGTGDILLGRIESIAACACVIFASFHLTLCSAITTPLFLIGVISLNLVSHLPKISSYPSVQKLTQESNDTIYRVIKIHLLAIPTIFLFLSASITNTLLPGVLGAKNIFFNAIHSMVEHLGELKTVRAVVPGYSPVVGTERRLSILEQVEEFFRGLSDQNNIKEVKTNRLTHHYTVYNYY